MNKLKYDLTGLRFHRWKVLGRDVSRKEVYWHCVCDCGTKRSVRGGPLKQGLTKSCGCYAIERLVERSTKTIKENKARTRGTVEYFKCNTWSNLKKRVVNSPSFDNRNKAYLRKGVKLLMTKEEFYSFCEDNREKILNLYKNNKTPSLDRINNEGDYSLENIQIISFAENRVKDRRL